MRPNSANHKMGRKGKRSGKSSRNTGEVQKVDIELKVNIELNKGNECQGQI